jgi:hypothetical protein
VTLVNYPSGLVPAAVFAHITFTGSLSALLMDAAGEKIAKVFRVPKTGNARTLRFRTGTVTTGETLKAGLYTVDASGLPTTTAYGGMVAGTVAVANNDDSVEKVVTLATDAAMTKGDLVALVIEWDSAVGALNLSYSAQPSIGFPYPALLTASWAKQLATPLFAVGYDDGTYPLILGANPYTGGITTVTFNSGTGTFDEHGILWTHPAAGRVMGILASMQIAAGADFEALMYDGTTAVATKAWDGDAFSNPSNMRAVMLPFDSPVEVAAGDVRRYALRPTTANSIQTMQGNVGVAGALEAALGLGNQSTRRLNQGAWDDALTSAVTHIVPIYDQIDNGAGGGGGGAGSILSTPIVRAA